MKIDKMDLIMTFVAIAQNRQLSMTADRLNVDPATVTRKLNKLENIFGQTLVNRSTHDISLTSVGERFLIEATEIVNQWERLEDRYKSSKNAMAGPLKVIAPVGMGQYILSGFAISFQKKYPNIQLTWILQNEEIRFSESGCDVWLSLDDVRDKNLQCRKLASTQRCLVASNDLIKDKHIQGPASVEKLPLVALNTKENDVIELTSTSNKSSVTIYPEIVFSTNNLFVLHNSLLNGLEFGVLPRWFAETCIDAGDLIEIIPEWEAPSLTLNALSSSSRYQNQRAEIFLKELSMKLSEVPGFRAFSDHRTASII